MKNPLVLAAAIGVPVVFMALFSLFAAHEPEAPSKPATPATTGLVAPASQLPVEPREALLNRTNVFAMMREKSIVNLTPAKPMIEQCYRQAPGNLPPEATVNVTGTLNAIGEVKDVKIDATITDAKFIECVTKVVTSFPPARMKLNRDVALNVSFRVAR